MELRASSGISRGVAGVVVGLVALVGCSSAPGSAGVGPAGSGVAPVGTSLAVPGATSAAEPAASTGPVPGSGGVAAAGAVPAGPVPLVTRPLNVAGLPATPCAALRPADLPGLGIRPTGGSAGGTQCAWTGVGGVSVRVVWESASVGGLLDVYADRSTMAYFQPTTVDGYPAVFASPFGDRRANGDCTIYAAVNNDTVFSADYQAAPANHATACQFATQAAADVIKNLGGA